MSAIDTVLGTIGTDTVAMLGGGTLAVNGVETIVGTAGTSDVVRLLIAGNVAVSAVESVIGTAAIDVVRLTGSTAVSVSAVETVIGTAGTADVATLLAAGVLSVSAIETVIGADERHGRRDSHRRRYAVDQQRGNGDRHGQPAYPRHRAACWPPARSR